MITQLIAAPAASVLNYSQFEGKASNRSKAREVSHESNHDWFGVTT